MASDPAADVFDLVYKAYSSFDADNEEGRRQLAAIRGALKGWFQSSPRFVGEAAKYCIEKFVTEELNHEADQYVMPQQLKALQVEHIFGKRHAKVLSTRPDGDLTILSRLFEHHVICGYLYSEFSSGQTARLATRAPQEFYEIWSPLTSSRLMTLFDPKSKDEGDVQGIWMTCTAQPILKSVERWGTPWERTDNWILTRYFYAGRLLRLLEGTRLTDDEVEQFYAAGFQVQN